MYFRRNLENKLLETIKSKKITALLGARQVGKTSILKNIQSQIGDKSIFIDLDIYENKQIFNSYTEVIRFLIFHGFNEKDQFYLFLDEFHTVAGINKILKNLYDNHSNLKIFATGSSSLEIVKTLKESLAGRKSIFYLYPLTFAEFLNFKEVGLGDIFDRDGFDQLPINVKNKLNEYLKEFCIFGGYPEIALCQNNEQKKEALKDIFDLFIKKDLIQDFHVKNPFAIFNILKYLAINTGQIVNYNDICKTTNVDINTLKKYLYLLEETFVIKHLPPFFTNKNKEIVKSPKIYFHDMGARNYFLGNFVELQNRSDNGFLIENFCFSEFLKKKDFYTNLKYWRDKNGREIDLILEKEELLVAYEIKYKKNLTTRDFSNLQFFQNEYQNAEVFMVNMNTDVSVKNVKNKIYFTI